MAISELLQQRQAGNVVLDESTDECPDCQTVMTLYYDNDVAGQLCENCGYERVPKSCNSGDYHLGY